VYAAERVRGAVAAWSLDGKRERYRRRALRGHRGAAYSPRA